MSNSPPRRIFGRIVAVPSASKQKGRKVTTHWRCAHDVARRFKTEFGTTPADFVERLRLDEARRRLSADDNSVESVGISVGFKSADAFRRAFERRLGVNPSDYRRRFSANDPFEREASDPSRVSLAA